MYKAIVLAAGEGTRMKSRKTKVLHEICGLPLISHVFDAAKESGFDEYIVVLGRNKEEVKEKLEGEKVSLITQKLGDNEPYGTGYAVSLCKDLIEDDDHVVVVFGDTPLLTGEVLKEMRERHLEEDADITVLSAELDDPKSYGRIIRKDGEFVAIVEKKDLTDDINATNEVNSGIFLFKGSALKNTIDELTTDNAKHEYLLTDTIGIARSKKLRVICHKTLDSDMILGVNDREDLYLCEEVMKKRIIKKLRKDGVTIKNPELVSIEKSVVIKNDVTLVGFCDLRKNTVIEEGTVICNSTIIDSKIGKDCEIINSYIEESEFLDNIKFGPFSHTRPKTKILSNAKIGNFVEFKNTTFGEGSKAGHLAYIGDADVGREVNIGCGSIFVNYDGKNKHRTTVEDYGFIGSNANLVAPVVVHKNGYVAAGSTITKDIPEDALALERAELLIKEDWVKKKNLKKGDSNEEL